MIINSNQELNFRNELISLLGSLVFATLVMLVVKLIVPATPAPYAVYFTLLVLMWVSRLLTRLRVRQVTVDKEGYRIIILFKGIMSGEKKVQASLDAVDTRLGRTFITERLTSGGTALCIAFLSKKRTIRLTGRFGFEEQELLALHNTIEESRRTATGRGFIGKDFIPV